MRFGNDKGYYELNAFPGCNQLVVSNHAFIKPQFRGKGEGGKQHEERLRRISELGYDAVICTVRADNAVQKLVLKAFKWQQVFVFDNRESGHSIEVWMRHI